MNKSIKPTATTPPQEHLAIEDLARLADGALDKNERQRFVRHLNRCSRCYQILQETLEDLSGEDSVRPVPFVWWKTKAAYALAASIILAVLIGGPLVFEYWDRSSPVISATLNLDQQLKDILLENDQLRWEKGPRLNRLVAALQQKGVQVEELDLVVLAKPYYQKKSLFGPPEVLHIRIENNVAYLEVREMD